MITNRAALTYCQYEGHNSTIRHLFQLFNSELNIYTVMQKLEVDHQTKSCVLEISIYTLLSGASLFLLKRLNLSWNAGDVGRKISSITSSLCTGSQDPAFFLLVHFHLLAYCTFAQYLALSYIFCSKLTI